MSDVACCQHPKCGRIDPVRTMFVLRAHEHTLDMDCSLRVCATCNAKVKR